MKDLQPNTVYKPTGVWLAFDYFGEAHCELCGHAVKYQYEIMNDNHHSVMIGSDCILKFGCYSPFNNEKYTTFEEIRIDMIRIILNKFIENKVNKSFIDGLLKPEVLANGFSPKQMIAIENIACGFKIPYNINWFKINLRPDRNRMQMDLMKNHAHWSILKYALNETQRKKYE